MHRVVILCLTIALSLAFPLPSYSYDFESAPYFIKTPEDLVRWLRHEFVYELKYPDYRQTVEETVRLRKGDCDDLAFVAQAVLNNLGIKSDVIVIKFRQMGVMHAICIFKQGETYNYISNMSLVKTGGRTVAEAVTQKFPDWAQIASMTADGEYGQIEERGQFMHLAASNLSAASLFGDLMGFEYKDIGMIQLVLQQQLASLSSAGMAVNAGTFITILKNRTFGYPSQHSIRFMFDDLELTPAGFVVACRAVDANGARRYYAVFSLRRGGDGGFSVTVYPQDEWQRTGGLSASAPGGRVRNVKKVPAGLVAPWEGPAQQPLPVADIHPM